MIFAVTLIRAYQFMIRPFLIGSCKFHPTCSDYAIEALQTHGLFRGGWLAFARLIRCHPFSPGCIDPVPPPSNPFTVSTSANITRLGQLTDQRIEAASAAPLAAVLKNKDRFTGKTVALIVTGGNASLAESARVSGHTPP